MIKKVSRTLNKKWNHVPIIIEETNDLFILEIDKLNGSLMSHLERLKETTIEISKDNTLTSDNTRP